MQIFPSLFLFLSQVQKNILDLLIGRWVVLLDLLHKIPVFLINYTQDGFGHPNRIYRDCASYYVEYFQQFEIIVISFVFLRVLNISNQIRECQGQQFLIDSTISFCPFYDTSQGSFSGQESQDDK